MASPKISELPTVSGLDGSEIFPLAVLPGNNASASVSTLRSTVLAAVLASVRASVTTQYGVNSPLIGQERGNTALWGLGGLSVPSQANVTLERASTDSYDNSVMTTTLLAGDPVLVMGYPQWMWGNAYVYGGVTNLPGQKIADLQSNWNHVNWEWTGTGRFNLLYEAMLTDVPVTAQTSGTKVLELAVMLHMPVTTKEFIFQAPYTNLGLFTDDYGRAWGCVFKAGSGSSQLGYCIFYPADMADRLNTEFDFVAMAKFAVPKIAGASDQLYLNGTMLGVEPNGTSGVNTIRRKQWERAFNNSPYLSISPTRENINPNSTFESGYGYTSNAGFTFPGDGTMTINSNVQSNRSWLNIPLVTGREYEITFTVSNLTAGGVRVDLTNNGSVVTTGTSRNTNGTFTETLVAGAGANAFAVTIAGATNALKVKNITITPKAFDGTVPVSDGTADFSNPDSSGLIVLF
jgi:hypothetical protein